MGFWEALTNSHLIAAMGMQLLFTALLVQAVARLERLTVAVGPTHWLITTPVSPWSAP